MLSNVGGCPCNPLCNKRQRNIIVVTAAWSVQLTCRSTWCQVWPVLSPAINMWSTGLCIRYYRIDSAYIIHKLSVNFPGTFQALPCYRGQVGVSLYNSYIHVCVLEGERHPQMAKSLWLIVWRYYVNNYPSINLFGSESSWKGTVYPTP